MYNFKQHDDDEVYVTDCPGCGKELKTRWAEHKCEGTLTDNPVVRFKRLYYVRTPKSVDSQDPTDYTNTTA
jgi:hypothetical protein